MPASPAISSATPDWVPAEAFMDGRLIIEEGEILDLINIIRGSHRWGRQQGSQSIPAQGQARIGHLLRTLNWKRAAPAQRLASL
jgi:cyclopropane-fatty-acyl-phospholipid synthase